MGIIRRPFLMLSEKLLSTAPLIPVETLRLLPRHPLLIRSVDDGIARAQDALTLLESRTTYSLFLDELHRVRAPSH